MHAGEASFRESGGPLAGGGLLSLEGPRCVQVDPPSPRRLWLLRQLCRRPPSLATMLTMACPLPTPHPHASPSRPPPPLADAQVRGRGERAGGAGRARRRRLGARRPRLGGAAAAAALPVPPPAGAALRKASVQYDAPRARPLRTSGEAGNGEQQSASSSSRPFPPPRPSSLPSPVALLPSLPLPSLITFLPHVSCDWQSPADQPHVKVA
eukprot:85898-Chlamydomonas_euryale.AAC.1